MHIKFIGGALFPEGAFECRGFHKRVVTACYTPTVSAIMDPNSLKTELKTLFQEYSVILAYLFGSQATGKVHGESDIDIAVLLGEGSPNDRLAIQLKLLEGLSRVCRSDRVDLVILNEAPPLLAYEVLRNGIQLYSIDDNARVEFQVRTLRTFEDTAPLRKALADAMEERARTGMFGRPFLTR